MRISILIDKYLFLFILLFCFGIFTPNLQPKLALLDTSAIILLDKISGSNIIKQIFWVSVFLLAVFRSLFVFRPSKSDVLFFLKIASIPAFCLVSVLWSDNDSLTLKRAFFQVVFCFSLLLSFCLAESRSNTYQVLYVCSISLILSIALSILLGVAFSSDYKLAGIANNKNVLGQSLLVCLVLYISYMKINDICDDKSKYVLFFLVLFLVMTASKTSNSLFIAFLFFSYVRIEVAKIFLTFFMVIMFVIFIFLPSLTFFYGDIWHLGQVVEDDFFTGRGIIWDTLYYDLDVFDKFMFGYGYGAYFGSGEIPLFFDDKYSFLRHIASSHNGYIDLLLQFGAIFSFFILFLFLVLVFELKNSWLISGVCVVFIYNFTESTLIKDQAVMWLLFIIVFAMNFFCNLPGSLKPKGV